MSTSKMMRLSVKFDENWIKEHGEGEKSIKAFVEAFLKNHKELELIVQSENHCEFSVKSEHAQEVQNSIESTLESTLGIKAEDKAVSWTVSSEQEQQSKEYRYAVSLTLDAEFVLSKQTEAKLPIERFVAQMGSVFENMTIESNNLMSCKLLITLPKETDLRPQIDKIIEAIGATGRVETLKINDFVESEPKKEESSHKQSDKQDEATTYKTVNTGKASKEVIVDTSAVMKQVDALVGSEAFKELAHELSDIHKQVAKHGTHDIIARKVYLFSIEDGCGYSTQLNLLAKVLHDHKLFNMQGSPAECPPEPPLGTMLEWLSQIDDKRIVSFDLSAWMEKTHLPEFKLFLRRLQTVLGRQILAFRIPFVDQPTRRRMQAALSDIMNLHTVTTIPYSMEQLKTFAGQLMADKGFEMQEGAWPILESRLIDEKRDGQFHGLSTVIKVVDAMLYEKHLFTTKNNDYEGERSIAAENLGEAQVELERTGQEMLDELIGIEAVKERINEVLTQIEASIAAGGELKPSMHMRFIGSPGTGKTTVARILGKLMKERGLLSKGQFFEYSGRDFCGQYIGETAPKTASMCRDAYGSVLFIDEAYSLYRGNDDSRDYGREAIDTLIAQMENHRTDFMIIMAGYQKDMKTLMDSNAGLASRIPYTIEFPNYNREELYDIFMQMVKRSFGFEPGLEQAVHDYFTELGDEMINSKDFANARFVRNLFERTWGKATVRWQLEPEGERIICISDFDKASAEREFQTLQVKRKSRIGF